MAKRRNSVRTTVGRGLRQTGISNRETPAEEATERRTFPPVDPNKPPEDDTGGVIGDGVSLRRSITRKEDQSKYADHPAPSARKVSGAFGRESAKPLARDERGSLHPRPRTKRGAAARKVDAH